MNKIKYLSILIAFMLNNSYALPVNGQFIFGNGNIQIKDQNMTISSESKNNIIKWDSFNLSNKDKLTFDKNNYLNLISDKNMTTIGGHIQADGNIFIVNPNGIKLLSGSNIKANKLGLITANIKDEQIDKFKTTGLINTSSMGIGKIKLLGKIQANNLILDGSQIIIKDINNIVDHSLVPLDNTKGENIQIKSSSKRIDIGAKEPENIEQLYKISASDGLYDHTGQIAIDNANDFLNIANDMSASYWLCDDINLNLSQSIGANHEFTGSLDGAFNNISYKLQTNINNKNIGLFSQMADARVENLKITNSSIILSGDLNENINIGALAGNAYGGVYNNVEVDKLRVDTNNISFNNKNAYIGGFIGSINSGESGYPQLYNVISSLDKNTVDSLRTNTLNIAGAMFGKFDVYKVHKKGIVAGINYNNLSDFAIGYSTNQNKLAISNTINEAIAENNNAKGDIITDNLNTNKHFLLPIFTNSMPDIIYDGKEHSYNEFNSSKYNWYSSNPIISTNKVIDAGDYQLSLALDSLEHYFIDTSSTTNKVNFTINKRDLGTIELGEYVIYKKDGQRVDIKDINISIKNLDKLNFANNQGIEDLNLKYGLVKIDDKHYAIEAIGDNKNYNFTVNGSVLVKGKVDMLPIGPSTSIKPMQTLKPAIVDYKKILDKTQEYCDYCAIKQKGIISNTNNLYLSRFIGYSTLSLNAIDTNDEQKLLSIIKDKTNNNEQYLSSL